MSIKDKSVIIIGSAFILLITILAVTARVIILPRFEELEKQELQHRISHVINTLNDAIDHLSRTTADWAAWDDTYAFIQNKNISYQETNLVEGTFRELRLNFMVFADRKGRIVHAQGFDHVKSAKIDAPAGLFELLSRNNRLTGHPDTKSRIKGVIGIPEGIVMICSNPITTSDETGPIRGSLIMGRFLSLEEIEHLRSVSKVDLHIRPYDNFRRTSSIPIERALRGEIIHVTGTEGAIVSGYSVMRDIEGEPALVIRTDMERRIFHQGESSLRYYIVSLIVFGILIVFIMIVLLRKAVFSGLEQLFGSIRDIKSGRDFTKRISITGDNDLVRLADMINDLLDTIECSRESLLKEKEQFRRLVEEAPMGISHVDKRDRYTYLNPKFIEMFGYNLEDIPNRTAWYKKAYPDPRVRSSVIRSAKPNPYEIEKGVSYKRIFDVCCSNGSYKTILFRRARMKSGDRLIIYEDITEQMRVKEALEQSEERFKELTEHLPETVFETDGDGKLTFLNRTGFETFGFTEDDFNKEITFYDMMGPECRETARESVESVMRGRRSGQMECLAAKKDGGAFSAITHFKSIRKDGKAAGIRGFLIDVTETKRLEAQIQRAQRMESIGTLAGGITHDFNNLLMGIQGNISLMLLDVEPGHPHYERMKNIEQFVRNGADLTKQILGFARGGKYETKPTDLNLLIEKTTVMFGRTRKEVRIHLKFQHDIRPVEVDRTQIEQVLLNLLVNSWQAMKRGGDIFVGTENVVLDRQYVEPHGVEAGRYVRISVTDTGEGIDKKDLNRIFDPFFTTKEFGRGSGLGLASAYGIIKNHAGIINAYSEKGSGATFNVYLPASEKQVAEGKETPDEAVGGVETVLMADDENLIVEVGSKMLERLGYTVLKAYSGREAVSLFKANAERIDLVILDMIMPDITGGEVFDRIKAIFPGIKVILSSGYSLNGQAAEILNRGCDGFLQKPFNLVDMDRKIRSVLDGE